MVEEFISERVYSKHIFFVYFTIALMTTDTDGMCVFFSCFCCSLLQVKTALSTYSRQFYYLYKVSFSSCCLPRDPSRHGPPLQPLHVLHRLRERSPPRLVQEQEQQGGRLRNKRGEQH